MADLNYLVPPKTFNVWSYVKMLRGLFPKGYLWKFRIFEERGISFDGEGIVTEEALGEPTITHS